MDKSHIVAYAVYRHFGKNSFAVYADLRVKTLLVHKAAGIVLP